MPRSRTLLLAGLAALPLVAGSLHGNVFILERDGRQRQTLKDCAAILEPLGPAKALPPPPLITIETRDKRFVPRVAITRPGGEVAFPNQDRILHNVFSITPGNAFDTGLYGRSHSGKAKVRQPGLVKVYCNVHHDMHAFLWVVETPWAQVLDARQPLVFDRVPPGSYRLRLWHPETGEKTWPVTIGTGITKGEWTLQVSQPGLEVHKNKFGKDYPKEKGSYDESYRDK